MGKKLKEKYYVVWAGKEPGIYTNWEQCQAQVIGFAGAKYKTFRTLPEATAAYEKGAEPSKEEKYYVVWAGKNPGIYNRWDLCQAQIVGFNGAKFKKFASLSEATAAFEKGAPASLNIYSAKKTPVSTEGIIANSLAVDAACSGNPGKMEFRGVWVSTGKEAFRFGPFEKGTNNIGEFLALVYGIGLVLKTNPETVIYSDSVNAISWVKAGKCKTKLAECADNKEIFDLIRKSEAWLKTPRPEVKIYKWNTKEWGEIPADFGRK